MIKRAFCVMMICLLHTLWTAGSVISGMARDEQLLLTCFDRYAQTESFGVPKADYPLYAAQLSAFFRHETDDPCVSAHPFHDYEVVHLFDVRTLMDGVRAVSWGCFAGGMAALAAAAVLFRRRRFCFLPGFAAFVLLAAAVIAYAALDFNRVFTLLHELLFTNDLWLLDPRTDLLIALMPEGMFMYLARRVFYHVLPLLILFSAAALISQKYAQPRQ